MAKQGKLTLVLEPETREELTAWAHEEGRPVGNLLRRIVHLSVERRRQAQQQEGAAA